MIPKELHEQVMALPRELRSELADWLSPHWETAEIAEDGAEKLAIKSEMGRELFAQVMRLPLAERQALVAALEETLLPEDEWERACLIEVQARMERLRRGEEKTHSFEALLKVLGR
ncbi:MAG: hypothetical protein RL095_498 [Verrucomicrobiota bacterium]|jgi:hypothetical protein